jgi:hypothetical protein
MRGAPFTWTKAGLELEIGFGRLRASGGAFFAVSASIEIVGTWDLSPRERPNSGGEREFPDHGEKFPDRPI